MSWSELREKTAALSLRERAILTVTALVVVLVLWFQFSFDGLLKQHTAANRLQQQAHAEMGSLSELMATLETRLSNDPNAPLRIEKQTLEQDLQMVAHEIESRLEHLVVPEKMADLARRVLEDFKGLELLSAENLAPKPLELNLGKHKTKPASARKDAAPERAESEQVIFEHGFRMTLRGSYFNALEFIQKLEEIEGFYWRSMSYEVERWPDAVIVIHVSTLSLEKEWIGV